MQRIGVRELRQNASRYLDRVKSGETVEVTERGRLVALLVPPDPNQAARERLIAAGRLIPAAGALRLPVRKKLTATADGSADILDQQRGDR